MASISAARLEKMFRMLPNVDASSIKGNLSAEENQINANIFAFYVSGKGGPTPIQNPFGRSVGEHLQITELTVTEEGASGRLEIEVTEDMCNVFGTMHGACGAYIIDHATIGTMVLYGRAAGFDGRGVSTSMNIHWHNPANLGDILAVFTESVHIDNRARTVRCEIRDKETRKLIITGTHSFLNAGAAAKL
ncbi:4HBT domain-containing protein [Mycena indigotica]|uniref:4HBT domain-containing protein n=1 Tax=Mycena indigotica TaxID=2126181 RepID=A0A8H6S433_9AGAR|nr:4HBT domain-containing protein [Mycena indigotica]KAF7292805.1 4HBT domain-containing protein [Mycena indigotica]